LSRPAQAAPRSGLDRALSLLPLVILYLLAASLYAWQASRRPSPTIFSDEIDFTLISRSLAETGRPGRLGEAYGLQSLYTLLVAPAWWIDNTKDAWEAAKLIGALVMPAALFPAYGLARMVVSRPWAHFAAAGAVAAPPLAFAPYLMDEPLAYPVSTLGLFLIARAALSPSLLRFALAGGVCAIATLVRGELGVLWVVLAFVAVALAWQTEPARRRRAGLDRWDWAGLAVLAIGAAVLVSAAIGHRSEPWYTATGFYKQRTLEHGLWAFGALSFGLGLLPFVAGLAGVGTAALKRDRNLRAFALTGIGAIVCFGVYAAVKGGFLSTIYGRLVLERNVIYLVPILFVGTAVVLERRRVDPFVLAAAVAFSVYLVVTTPYHLDKYPYFEAPGLAILAFANRELIWDQPAIERALLVVLAVSVVVLLAVLLIRARRTALLVGWAAAALVLTWGLTTEIYAARGLNTFAKRLYDNTPQPVNWVDQVTGGEKTLFLGQSIIDKNPIYLLEFWNRSVGLVWSLDGSAPLPTLSPDLGAPDGTLTPDPGVRWVVATDGVEVVGERGAEPRGGLTLFRIDGPLRLRYGQTGVYPDGWMGASAGFSQYAPEAGTTRGFARIVLSREAWCGKDIPGKITVRVGPVVVRDKQPGLGTPVEVRHDEIHSCEQKTFVIPARVPYRVEVEITPTFSPGKIDPALGDLRELGARVSFGFIPL
jgi:multisubunit Na+/H+ antiporter MnhB subunit